MLSNGGFEHLQALFEEVVEELVNPGMQFGLQRCAEVVLGMAQRVLVFPAEGSDGVPEKLRNTSVRCLSPLSEMEEDNLPSAARVPSTVACPSRPSFWAQQRRDKVVGQSSAENGRV